MVARWRASSDTSFDKSIFKILGGILNSYSWNRDCLDMLATSTPMIFHEWFFKASVRNGSPPRHQGILNSYYSKRACFDMLATSPPRIFKIDLSKHVSEFACHLATNDLLILMVQREPVLICSPPRHQSFLNWYCFKRSFLDMLATSIPMILKNYLSKYIFWVAVGLATRVWQNQLDDKFLRSNWRVSEVW